MSDDLEHRLGDWMRREGDVSHADLARVAAGISGLPRGRRVSLAALMAAAALVLVAVVGIAVIGSGSGGTAGGSGATPPSIPSSSAKPTARATPPDPAAFAGDPRLVRCGGVMTTIQYVFEMRHASDYRRHFPAMLLAPELDTDQPALAVVYGADARGPFTGGAAPPPGTTWPPRSLAPGHRELCVIVGAVEVNWYSDVDITGMAATLSPESLDPTTGATPTATTVAGVTPGPVPPPESTASPAPASPPPETPGSGYSSRPGDPVRLITRDEPRTSARLSVIERSGSACLVERLPDLVIEALDLEGKAARLAGRGGILEAGTADTLDEGDAYLGTAIEAAAAFGAYELHQRAPGPGGIAVGTTLAFPGASDPALVGYELQAIPLADGRIAHVVTANFRSVACAPVSPS